MGSVPRGVTVPKGVGVNIGVGLNCPRKVAVARWAAVNCASRVNTWLVKGLGTMMDSRAA